MHLQRLLEATRGWGRFLEVVGRRGGEMVEKPWGREDELVVGHCFFLVTLLARIAFVFGI